MAAKETIQTYSTAETAKVLGVSTSTVIKWDREGTMNPSTERKHGEERRYSERDLIALSIGKDAVDKRLQPYPDAVHQLVAMVQRGDEAEMKRAEIHFYQEKTGVGYLVFINDMKDPDNVETMKIWKKRGMRRIGARQTLWSLYETCRDYLRTELAARLSGTAKPRGKDN